MVGAAPYRKVSVSKRFTESDCRAAVLVAYGWLRNNKEPISCLLNRGVWFTAMPDKKKKHDWLLLKCSTIREKCDVTLPGQLNFWIQSQQSLLTETAIFIFERWRKSMSYCFVPECNHALASHLSFSTAIFAGPRFVEIHKFCYHGNKTSLLV